MKRYLMALVLGMALLAMPTFGAQNGKGKENKKQDKMPNKPQTEMMQKMHAQAQEIEMREKELDLAERESEVNYNNEMRNIEIEKERAKINRPEGPRPPMNCGPCGPQFSKQGKHHEGMRCPVAGKIKDMMGLMFLICLVMHILLPIWVYQDIRKRNAGSRIWIVVTLLTGIVGALLYALVRIGDNKA